MNPYEPSDPSTGSRPPAAQSRADVARDDGPGRTDADPAALPTSTSVVRVRYAETDKMGVAYYANYFVWFEVARADLLRSLGWSYRDMEHAGVTLPVIHAECQYHTGARYDDELEVRTAGRRLSPVRMEFTYEVVRRADRVVTASGRTVHAAVAPNGRPCRLPARILQVFP